MLLLMSREEQQGFYSGCIFFVLEGLEGRHQGWSCFYCSQFRCSILKRILVRQQDWKPCCGGYYCCCSQHGGGSDTTVFSQSEKKRGASSLVKSRGHVSSGISQVTSCRACTSLVASLVTRAYWTLQIGLARGRKGRSVLICLKSWKCLFHDITGIQNARAYLVSCLFIITRMHEYISVHKCMHASAEVCTGAWTFTHS